ncbi:MULTISPECIES: hypothetical protein [Microbacterium]|uniref:Lipoprotein n=1 Tax=Microbacterium wangchenii TaxID=2541726 RepID=A0ABX5SSK1_9MICO|nr:MULTISPECIES: hypothetical protein [Microbacterium]MCK6068514.1 hypothetical protein [Microbacterium sp. EYE_512]QBR89138.1 hypothetical protein E4K62_10845 [Microbacterium wangchenii]TXK09230.1 hypothetical protein FVP99_18350 [Microbacterium wangchenii]
MNRMQPKFPTASLVIVALIGLLAGCSSQAGANEPTPKLEEAATPSASASANLDEQTCLAFGDVSTILQNAERARREQRMTQQEYDGWQRLATRVLGRIPTSGDGPVSDAMEVLQKLAPAIPNGMARPTKIGTAEWWAAAPIGEACARAGYQLAGEGFTGG